MTSPTPEEALASRLKVYAEIARANAAYEKRSVGDLSGYDDQANDLEAAARAILASGALKEAASRLTISEAGGILWITASIPGRGFWSVREADFPDGFDMFAQVVRELARAVNGEEKQEA